MDASSSQRACVSAPTLPTPTLPTTPFPATSDIPSPEICVICLELLARSDTTSGSSIANSAREAHGDNDHGRRVATALPCQHAQFHHSCLGTWLGHSPACPLCKTAILSISIHRDGSSSPEIIDIPTKLQQPTAPLASPRPTHTHAARQSRRRRHLAKSPIHEDPVLAFRRNLYDRGIPSLYRGRGITRTTSTTNQHTGRRHQRLRLQPITPSSFSPNNPNSAHIQRLATIWIRRELQLFPFLHPTSSFPPSSATASFSSSSPSPSPAWLRPPLRRTTAAFLLPYILAILRAIDLRGAAGQAQALLGEYLGRDNAVLFCHELYAFLGSGAGSVGEWDGGVQYWADGNDGDGEGVLWSGMGEVLGTL